MALTCRYEHFNNDVDSLHEFWDFYIRLTHRLLPFSLLYGKKSIERRRERDIKWNFVCSFLKFIIRGHKPLKSMRLSPDFPFSLKYLSTSTCSRILPMKLSFSFSFSRDVRMREIRWDLEEDFSEIMTSVLWDELWKSKDKRLLTNKRLNWCSFTLLGFVLRT